MPSSIARGSLHARTNTHTSSNVHSSLPDSSLPPDHCRFTNRCRNSDPRVIAKRESSENPKPFLPSQSQRGALQGCLAVLFGKPWHPLHMLPQNDQPPNLVTAPKPLTPAESSKVVSKLLSSLASLAASLALWALHSQGARCRGWPWHRRHDRRAQARWCAEHAPPYHLLAGQWVAEAPRRSHPPLLMDFPPPIIPLVQRRRK